MQKKIRKTTKTTDDNTISFIISFICKLFKLFNSRQSKYPSDWLAFLRSNFREKNNISKKKQQLTYAIWIFFVTQKVYWPFGKYVQPINRSTDLPTDTQVNGWIGRLLVSGNNNKHRRSFVFCLLVV